MLSKPTIQESSSILQTCRGNECAGCELAYLRSEEGFILNVIIIKSYNKI